MKSSAKLTKARKRNFHLYLISGITEQLKYIHDECHSSDITDQISYTLNELDSLRETIRKDKRSSYVKNSN